MAIQLTDEEIEIVDRMMGDHMYGHAISKSYLGHTCNPLCRRKGLKYSINTVLREIKPRHELAQVIVHRPTYAEYICSCGESGKATMADHLASPPAIEARVIKNHEYHQVRALKSER